MSMIRRFHLLSPLLVYQAATLPLVRRVLSGIKGIYVFLLLF